MDERLEELRRQLDQKTTEIESLVAADQGMGSIENMEPSKYERLEQTVEELLGRWEETAQEEGPGSIDDTPLNRLIAERFEIEQHILANRGEQPEADDVEGGEPGAGRLIAATAAMPDEGLVSPDACAAWQDPFGTSPSKSHRACRR
jgi:hypothetical protein